jgi:hypothetical protein
MNLPFSHDAFLDVGWPAQHAALAGRGGALGRTAFLVLRWRRKHRTDR